MKNKKKKKKVPYARLLIPWIIVAVVTYTICAFVVQLITGAEISSTLTTCWFSFWGVELISLATIKTMKVRGGKDGRDLIEDEQEQDE